MTDWLIYQVAWTVVRLLQALPLRVVALLGRCGGALAYAIDRRHRNVALDNLTRCFATEKSALEIRQIAREHFRRLGENYCCAVKTASMRSDQIRRCMQIVGQHKFLPKAELTLPTSHVVAIGHFGNFELYASSWQLAPGYRAVTTYRGLRQPRLNQLLLSLRQRTGCLYFERRLEGLAFRRILREPQLMIGLLSDQHAGRSGVRVPFFGIECSTSTAPAVLALRYRLPLRVGVCYRIALGRWRLEVGDEIPTQANGERRSVAAIMTDVNCALERAVRRDPANWFWVHKRWKPAGKAAEPRQSP